MAAEVGEARGFAVEEELEIRGAAAANAGLALTVVRVREEDEQPGEKCEDEASFQFPFQSGIQATYNTLFPSRLRFLYGMSGHPRDLRG